MGFNQNKLLGTLLLALAQFASATTWYVNGVTGSDSNNCKSATTACKTIGHAISLVSSGDSILVAAATYTENLTITINLTILGASASKTIIDGGGANTVVTVSNGTAHVVLSQFTIRNGFATTNTGPGAGVSNSGTLTINNAIITGNTAGGGQSGGSGGGVFNGGTMTINNSTINKNSATGWGGGIWNDFGTLKVNDSTISGNAETCSFRCFGVGGGGIANAGATTTINNSTIARNTGANGGGIGNFYGTVTRQQRTCVRHTARL